MKFVPSLAASAFTLLALHSLGASAQCSSYGLDIGDGNTVYINPLSAQPFSFQGGFSGETEILYEPVDGNRVLTLLRRMCGRYLYHQPSRTEWRRRDMHVGHDGSNELRICLVRGG